MDQDGQHIHIPAADGFALAATVYAPSSLPNGDQPPSVVIINSATAVPRLFYKAYARHLSQNGSTAITYDYRGIGESRPKSLKGFNARMRDWAELDMAGVVEWASAQYPAQPLFVIGHSIGGQGMGLLHNHGKVTAMVTLSAQSGYWGLHPGVEKYRVAFFVFLAFPLLANAFGYFPWSRMAPGEDLPKGVALEWARWCRSPRYLFGDPTLESLRNFPNFSAPILAYSRASER
jgi:predicted alpha/beta hydrolase